jgi:hypothetical protein
MGSLFDLSLVFSLSFALCSFISIFFSLDFRPLVISSRPYSVEIGSPSLGWSSNDGDIEHSSGRQFFLVSLEIEVE